MCMLIYEYVFVYTIHIYTHKHLHTPINKAHDRPASAARTMGLFSARSTTSACAVSIDFVQTFSNVSAWQWVCRGAWQRGMSHVCMIHVGAVFIDLVQTFQEVSALHMHIHIYIYIHVYIYITFTALADRLSSPEAFFSAAFLSSHPQSVWQRSLSTYTYVYMCICIYIYSYIYIYIYMCIYIYIHVYIYRV